MTDRMSKTEHALLSSWKLKLALLMAIVTPTVGMTGAYWKIKGDVLEARASADARLSAVELNTQKSFAEKSDLKDMQREISAMHDDIIDIKSILKQRR